MHKLWKRLSYRSKEFLL